MVQEVRNALPNGTQFDGYQIEGVLGAGGFGITYLAREVAINRKVAIKEFLPGGIAVRDTDKLTIHPISTEDGGDFQYGLDRFRMEAETLVALRHPSIVPVFRYFEANGSAYMVMEYQEGRSLAQILKEHGTLDESALRELLFPLLEGLIEVHKKGFLHRDIKPDNIYIRDDGSPVLIDFGSARQALGAKSQSLTAIVTAGYAPYEQYYVDGAQGPWTDIYGLAATLYRAITGKPPPAALGRMKEDPMIPAATAAGGRYDADFLAAIDAGLAFDEERRPQTIKEWWKMLDGTSGPVTRETAAIAGGATVRAGDAAGVLGEYAKGTVPARPQDSGGGRRMVPLVIAGILVLVAAGAGAWYFVEEDRRAKAAEDALRLAQEETLRQAGITEAERQAEAEEAARQAETEEAARQAAEEARRAAEEAGRTAEEARQAAEEARQAAEEEAARQAAAEEAARQAAEEEAARQAAEETQTASIDPAAHRCDELAADVWDPGRRGGGVTWEALNARAALEACRQAVDSAPGAPRFLAQLARAMFKNNEDAAAVAMFREAAEAGQASAMYHLGWAYRDGYGVTADGSSAVAWYRRAAEAGHAYGQYMYGDQFYYGNDVPQDYGQARTWYRRAAEQGHPSAMNDLGFLYHEGLGVAVDYGQARTWYEQAAEAMSPTGMYNLGNLYELGQGVGVSYAEAFFWYTLATKLGETSAPERLAVMASYLSAQEQGDLETRALAWAAGR